MRTGWATANCWLTAAVGVGDRCLAFEAPSDVLRTEVGRLSPWLAMVPAPPAVPAPLHAFLQG
jgi:hypothetical protein